MKFNFVKSDTFKSVLQGMKKAFIFSAFSTLFIGTYVFAAISWPTNSPDGSSINGLFMDYFDKIFTSPGSATNGIVKEAASVSTGSIMLSDLSQEVLDGLSSGGQVAPGLWTDETDKVGVDVGVRIGNIASGCVDGAIKYNGVDFFGCSNNIWKSLTGGPWVSIPSNYTPPASSLGQPVFSLNGYININGDAKLYNGTLLGAGAYVSIDTGYSSAEFNNCILNDSGKASCWGTSYDNIKKFFVNKETINSYNEPIYCILTNAGDFKCDRYFGAKTNVKDFSVSPAFDVYILKNNGNLDQYKFKLTTFIQWEGPTEVYSGGDGVKIEGSCLLKPDGNVLCYSSSIGDYNYGDAKDISSSSTVACVIDSGNDVFCWGGSSFKTTSGDILQVKVMGNTICYLNSSREVWCNGTLKASDAMLPQ